MNSSMTKSGSSRVSYSWGGWWKAFFMVGQNYGFKLFPYYLHKALVYLKKYLPRLLIKWHLGTMIIHTDHHGGTKNPEGSSDEQTQVSFCSVEFVQTDFLNTNKAKHLARAGPLSQQSWRGRLPAVLSWAGKFIIFGDSF